MFKKIITFLLVFTIFFSTSLAETNKFIIEKVNILTKNKIEVIFSNVIKDKENYEESFKITDKDNNEIVIKKAIKDKNKILIDFYKDLKTSSKYKILVLDLEDIDGNTIEKGYDASIEFTTPEKFEKIKKEENSQENSNIENKKSNNKQENSNIENKTENNNQGEINNKQAEEKKEKIITESKSSSTILSDEELEKIREKVLSPEEKKAEEIKRKILEKKQKIEQENILTNSNLDGEIKPEIQEGKKFETNLNSKTNILEGQQKNNSKTNKEIIVEDLPTAGTTENILILLSLIIGLFIFYRKKA